MHMMQPSLRNPIIEQATITNHPPTTLHSVRVLPQPSPVFEPPLPTTLSNRRIYTTTTSIPKQPFPPPLTTTQPLRPTTTPQHT